VAQPRQVDFYDYTGQAHFVKPLAKFQAPYGCHEQRAYKYASAYRPFYCTDCPPVYLLHSMRHRAEWSIMERTSYLNLKYPLHQKQVISYIATCWQTAFYILTFYVLILHMYL